MRDAAIERLVRAMEDPCRIRAFDTADTGPVTALWERAGVLGPHADPAADIRDCLESGRGALRLALLDGEIAGTVMCGHDTRRGWLYYVAVDPDRRGRGLGRRLVGVGEDWVRAAGFELCSLMVRDDRVHNISFYRRLGYRIEPDFHQDDRHQDDRAVTPGVRMTRWIDRER